MKFTVADLLDQLSTEEARPLARLEKAFGLSLKADKQLLRIGIDGLSRLGLVQEEEDGLKRCDDPTLIWASLRCSSKGFCFALREDGGEDIYIRDHLLNHAWNGDRVLVRITREGGRRRSPEGGVQCVLERATTSLLAQVEQRDDQLVAVPLDERLLTAVALPASDSSHLHSEQEAVVEVRVDRFPVAQFPPQGHVARSLPVHGGPEADLDLLLTKHGLQDRSDPPKFTLKAPATRDRLDLTALPTLLPSAWSGPGAPLLPGLSLESLDDGWRLWVHAPSIAERLGVGSNLEHWLREQGEAICLGSRWLPLLPATLTRAASFAVGKEQEAVSVALELGLDGSLRHYRFSRSRIKPAAVIDGAALQALVDRKPKARTVPAALKGLKDHLGLLEQLVALTGLLRQARLAAGSLDLDLPLPALERLGDLSTPTPDAGATGWLIQLQDHHPMALLREAVLLAHRALGRHLQALALPALFAGNAPADSADVNEVAKAALALEIPLELAPDGNASPAELASVFAASDRSRVLQQQLTDTLQPVLYGADPSVHAVAGEEQAYAPWCCAGLHFGDLWNQQLLVTLLAEGKDRPSVRHKVTVDLASDQCHGSIDWPLLTPTQLAPFQQAISQGLPQRLNTRLRFQQDVHADVLAMAQARQAEPLTGQVVTGVISGIQSYGFFVEVPPSQVEGLVHVSALKDDWYEYRSRQNRLVGRKNRRTYRLGDPVEVEVQKVDVLRHQIDLAVILPEGSELDSEQQERFNAASSNADDGLTASGVSEGDRVRSASDRFSASDADEGDGDGDGDGDGEGDGFGPEGSREPEPVAASASRRTGRTSGSGSTGRSGERRSRGRTSRSSAPEEDPDLFVPMPILTSEA
ncbi:MAG: RNB domain-containing ribonuclease [Cyanobacteriota bacterium]